MNFFAQRSQINEMSFHLMKVIASGGGSGYYGAPQKIMAVKFTSRVPWREKLERQQEPKIVDIPARMQARFGKGRM